ncbi:hypothetical protein JST97_02380 [bacterium]|nr:hypothetical protein [bacterium]
MAQRFALVALLTWSCSAASEWAQHRNQEADPARPLGWSFEVPSSWKQFSVAKFPYPLGESWNGDDGSFQVCWLGDVNTIETEQYALEQRGFVRGSRTVAGREGVWLQKNTDCYCYIKSPKGTCRLHMTCATPLVDHILQSFTLIQTQEVAPGGEQKFSDWTFELPTGWTFKAPDLLVIQGEPVARMANYSLPPTEMVRGWARNQASQENPKLKEREGMEPFSSKKGIDGYLVEWKGADGPVLFAYAARGTKGLRFELLRASELDRLRRLLNSLAFKG